jgi:dephospho-CoA kinase
VSRPIAVAITGGIGAGKSEALAAFRRHGAATVSSDEIVHRLLREDEDVRGELVERFGERILDDVGQVDRTEIAKLVFGDRDQLDWLERLLHPRVAQEYLEWREQLGRLPNPPEVCVTEVPLLYEVGGDERFDMVVVITAPAEVRAERSQMAGELREGRLLPDEEKARRADFVYVNDGSFEELDEFVAGVMQALST